MYKTLSRLAKARNTLPVLSCVSVQNGVAKTTDIDVEITAPCALKDGTYHGHCFDKSIYLDAEIPLCDVPELKIGKKIVGEFDVTADEIENLKWVSIAMSTEDTRYYLNGIFLDKGGKFVATDGHRLNLIEKHITWHEATAGVVIPRKFVNLFFALFKELKAEKASFTIHKGHIVAQINDCAIKSKLIDGTFPEYQKVIPDYGKCKIKSKFKARDLVKALPELTAINKANGGDSLVSVKLKDGKLFSTHSKKYEYMSTINTGDIVIGFNAVYLSKACDGIAYVEDAGSPMVIIDRRGTHKKTCVVMPLRV